MAVAEVEQCSRPDFLKEHVLEVLRPIIEFATLEGNDHGIDDGSRAQDSGLNRRLGTEFAVHSPRIHNVRWEIDLTEVGTTILDEPTRLKLALAYTCEHLLHTVVPRDMCYDPTKNVCKKKNMIYMI